MKRIIGLLTIFLFSFATAPAMADPVARDMGCSPTVANPCNGGSTGSSGPDPTAAAIGQALGHALGEAFRGDPEAEAKQKARAAARRRAEEQELKRHEEMKDRLLGNMMGVDSGSGLSLMTDDLQVKETRGAFGSTEVKPAGIASPPADHGLQLMLGDDAAKSSRAAGQGFDTAGKMLGGDLPPPPPTPSISAEKAKFLNALKAKLKKNEAEEQALKDQLAQLKLAPAPDPVAINQVQEKIVVKEKEKKKIKLDLTADDPDAPGTGQSSSKMGATSAGATATGASH